MKLFDMVNAPLLYFFFLKKTISGRGEMPFLMCLLYANGLGGKEVSTEMVIEVLEIKWNKVFAWRW